MHRCIFRRITLALFCETRQWEIIESLAYVVSVMDNSLFSWKKDQSSYYFLLNSAESISLLRRFVLALQLRDINIHTIIRWNDDDDCYCYYQYYYCCCSLFVFWGAVNLLIYFNRSDILWILHGFVHVLRLVLPIPPYIFFATHQRNTC